jgi:hypothetical protein
MYPITPFDIMHCGLKSLLLYLHLFHSIIHNGSNKGKALRVTLLRCLIAMLYLEPINAIVSRT